MGVEVFGLVMGLGFVLSFGYWCTDFLVVQRAMAADSMSAARRTPLIAALPKMVFPLLVILPGMIAIALPVPNRPARNASASQVQQMNESGKGLIPAKIDETTGAPMLDADGKPVLDYDLAIPNMLLHYFPTGLLGLGLTALLASFMSGMAGNVTAFNTVWTYDIYQSYINKMASDEHLLWMGRIATVSGIGLSVAAAYAATRFNNIMDFSAIGVRVCECSAVCDVSPGYVLEAHHWARGFLRPHFRHCIGRDASRADLTGWRECGHQRRMDYGGTHLPERDGAEFLDGNLGVLRVSGSDRRDQPDHSPTG